MRPISIFFICMLFAGCQKPYQNEFVHVVRNHQTVTAETTASLIESINDRLVDTVSDEERGDLENLKERLLFLSSSAAVIERYILEVDMDESLLQELLRHIWKGESE